MASVTAFNAFTAPPDFVRYVFSSLSIVISGAIDAQPSAGIEDPIEHPVIERVHERLGIRRKAPGDIQGRREAEVLQLRRADVLEEDDVDVAMVALDDLVE